MKNILFGWMMLIPSLLFAAGDINVLDSMGNTQFTLTEDIINNNSILMSSKDISLDVDPKVHEAGRPMYEFQGIPLYQVLELAEVDPLDIVGITVISTDSYVTFIDADDIYNLGEDVMIANARNGEDISKADGGHYKLMYHHAAEKHRTSYNFGVRAIYLGSPAGSTLLLSDSVQAKQLEFNSDGLYDEAEHLELISNANWVSPRGDHFILNEEGRIHPITGALIQGVTLEQITPHLRESRVELAGYNILDLMNREGFLDAQWKGVVVKTLTGQIFNIPPEMLEDREIMLVTIYEAIRLPISKGGPLALRFPTRKWKFSRDDEHAKWLKMAPTFGLMYFVTDLQVP